MRASGAESNTFGPAEIELFLSQLSREPDLEAPELLAYDATDSLLLQTVAAEMGELVADEVAVIGDRHGALTLGLAKLQGVRGIRTHQDALLGERALDRNAERLGLTGTFTHHELDSQLLAGARVVVMQLPRGLEALTEISESIARWADPEVRVFAGGRVKHMTKSMNDVLAQSFAKVNAGLGWRKSRVLAAREPRESIPESFPKWAGDPELTFELAAYGATFGGPSFDHGSRLLLQSFETAPHPATCIVDLGCGNGVLAVAASKMNPGARVIATDQSCAAVAATRLTADRAGVGDRISVHRADATEAVPEAWAELMLLNPPFHSGATVHAGVAYRLIEACGRALAPGGELRIVYNSHLGYRSFVERVIGPTRQIARDRTFTVLSAIRRR